MASNHAINHASRQLELVEVRAWADLYKAVPDQVAQENGIGLVSTPSTCLSYASRIDVLAFNRVIGAGIDRAIDADLQDSYIARYRSHNIPRFFVQLHPEAVGPEIDALMRDRGYSHYNNWIKLERGVELIHDVDCELDVRQIDRNHAESFAHILVESFEWPANLKPWIAATVGRKYWHHYMAFDDDTPVATGAFYFRDGYAWIDMAATLPEYRGRGAQGALVARRIRDLSQMGCHGVVVETAEQTKDKEAPSYRNMIRYGFKQSYTRPNYIFEF